MRTHVPAIGQQCHRMRKESDSDLEDHHHRSDADHDTGASFRPGKIGNEVVRLFEARMSKAMHGFQNYAIFNGGKGCSRFAVRSEKAKPHLFLASLAERSIHPPKPVEWVKG